jgi:hypothetical protein
MIVRKSGTSWAFHNAAICCGAYGSYWHLADIAAHSPDVAFGGKADIVVQGFDVRF